MFTAPDLRDEETLSQQHNSLKKKKKCKEITWKMMW